MSLVNIINELVVTSVGEAIEFYKNNFGFVLEESYGVPVIWAKIKKENMVLMFEDYSEICKEINNYPKKVASSNLIMFEYSDLAEVKELYSLLKKNKVTFFSDYTETDYGKVEFGVYDLDKNMILISAMI